MEASGAGAHFLDNELQRIHRDMHMIAAHTVFDVDAVGARARARAAEGRRVAVSSSTPSTAGCATRCSTRSSRATSTAVERCYAPDMTMWFNVTGEDIDARGEPRRARPTAPASTGGALYNDRIISTFDDGFVVQYTATSSRTTARRSPLSACLVAEVHDGKITKLFEYLDSGSSRPATADAVTEYEIRELCEAFFDAYQNRRVDVLDRLYADDCIIWHNVFGRETTRRREPRGAARRLQGPAPAHLQRPHHQHVPRRLRDPVLAQRRAAQRAPRRAVDLHRRPVRDGKITRIDEYMDSGKFAAWAGTSEGAR